MSKLQEWWDHPDTVACPGCRPPADAFDEVEAMEAELAEARRLLEACAVEINRLLFNAPKGATHSWTVADEARAFLARVAP